MVSVVGASDVVVSQPLENLNFCKPVPDREHLIVIHERENPASCPKHGSLTLSSLLFAEFYGNRTVRPVASHASIARCSGDAVS